MRIQFHQGLTLQKWQAVPLDQKILNIASELTRAKNASTAHNQDALHHSLERVIELMDLSVEAQVRTIPGLLREFLMLRKFLAEIYLQTAQDTNDLLLALKNLIDLVPSVHNLKLEF